MATQTFDPVYTATVSVTGGRQAGKATSSDGLLDLRLSPPSGKTDNPGTNPEQLFAAGYAACFQSALMSIARADGANADDSTVTADVSLGKEQSGAYGLAVILTVAIPGMGQDDVQRLADLAHQRCPYSRATRGNIDVQIMAAT